MVEGILLTEQTIHLHEHQLQLSAVCTGEKRLLYQHTGLPQVLLIS